MSIIVNAYHDHHFLIGVFRNTWCLFFLVFISAKNVILDWQLNIKKCKLQISKFDKYNPTYNTYHSQKRKNNTYVHTGIHAHNIHKYTHIHHTHTHSHTYTLTLTHTQGQEKTGKITHNYIIQYNLFLQYNSSFFSLCVCLYLCVCARVCKCKYSFCVYIIMRERLDYINQITYIF